MSSQVAVVAGAAEQLGWVDAVVPDQDGVFVGAHELRRSEDELVEQSVAVDRCLAVGSHEFEDVAANKGHNVRGGGDLADGYVLLGEHFFGDDWPLTDAVLVEFVAAEVKLLLMTVVVDHVAVRTADH